MKKTLLIVSLILIIASACMVYFIWNFNNADCPPPERPKNVPMEAKWCGGCDGGHWIYLVPDGLQYHFRVYNDFTGTLLMDAIFLPEKADILVDENNWKKKVFSYTSDSDGPLMYIILTDSSYTHLVSQYPAFGGMDWDIIKEKYSLHFTPDSLKTH